MFTMWKVREEEVIKRAKSNLKGGGNIYEDYGLSKKK